MKTLLFFMLLSFWLLAGTAQAQPGGAALAAGPPQTELPGQGPGEAPIKAVPRAGHQAKPRRLDANGQPNARQ
ncbi:hypothetical protein, partial [Hymenobacter convexus]|uniref:hypothetical protein n=1 Tax=Hymenobacter sp. CA1UV-4 TaxID=3063782 RepID=UPI002712712D